jgi:hypothetical protein
MTNHPDISSEAEFRLSPGEIHYLYWYIQGSIMVPEIRQSLRKAWGFCERHAWAAMLVESAFRPSFLHGPSILYEDIMSRAVPAFDLSGPLQNFRLRINLREKGACMMCEMGYGPGTKGYASPDIIEKGGDPAHLRAFALTTKKHWVKTVCGRCVENGSLLRCRRHLIEDTASGSLDSIFIHRNLVRNVYDHLVIYVRSFCWDYRGTATEEDRAALISAIGWCSGWRPLLQIMEGHGLLEQYLEETGKSDC